MKEHVRVRRWKILGHGGHWGKTALGAVGSLQKTRTRITCGGLRESSKKKMKAGGSGK